MQKLEPDMEKYAGSKLRTEYVKAILSCLFTLYAEYIMRNTGLDEAQAGIKIQFSLVAQSCPTLCNPMNHSTPGLPVHHQLLEFTQTHVH